MILVYYIQLLEEEKWQLDERQPVPRLIFMMKAQAGDAFGH